MFRKINILLLLVSLGGWISGQSISDFLETVSEKNPEILAFGKLLEAKRIEARTGLTPSDPFISAGFMPGSTGEAGNKKIWSVNQSFDFPSKYLLQKKLNKSTILLAEQEFNLGRLLVLLEAKLAVLDMIHNTKAINMLRQRKSGYERLKSAWEIMLDKGETTIMDYNRILMELSAVNLEITKREAENKMLNEKLQFMSGSDSDLPVFEEYPLFTVAGIDTLIIEKSEIHPAFLIPEIEYQVNKQEVNLSKTGSLPGFQIGYGSEIVNGVAYTGPVAGLSIPLWSNSNRIRSAQAAADHSATVRDATLLKLKLQVSNEYAKMNALQKSISEVTDIMNSGSRTKFPDMALSVGEISIITYFMYLEALYHFEDRLLEMENEYHRSVAILLDHQLAVFGFASRSFSEGL